MDFLRGLKSRKTEEPEADLDAKIVFSRPDRHKPAEKAKDEKSSLKEKSKKPGNIGGAIRMDEYVVGAPKAKVQKGKSLFLIFSLYLKLKFSQNVHFIYRTKIYCI